MIQKVKLKDATIPGIYVITEKEDISYYIPENIFILMKNGEWHTDGDLINPLLGFNDLSLELVFKFDDRPKIFN
ncbi:MAG: hypothetical protein RBR68_14325 [Tenuifilaceae bacterium]|nr:hypothetical protein [Tenuifilaceae bacterium]